MNIDVQPAGRYLLDFDTRDLPRYATDVLVVGGGVAGLSAALAAAESADVMVALKDASDQSNTAWAQGGIAAVVSDQDSVELHLQDTLRVGGGLCDPEVVRTVVSQGRAAIEQLIQYGAGFDAGGDQVYELGREAGHSVPRIVHAQGDATGAEVARALTAAADAVPSVRVVHRLFMVDLLTADGRCVGILGRRYNGEIVAVTARSVVLAAGGAGRIYRETTNARGATGDGAAAAYRAGAVLRDLEFFQFHPTTLYLAGSVRALITEAARGDGAYLIDNLGRRFLEPVHPAVELAPRDIVSRSIQEHMAQPDVTDIYLDMRHWPEGHAAKRFPGLARLCARYGLDPKTHPIPVRPAAHYFIGGVASDLDGRTNLPGLYACGEAACTGMNGANRLASNSLLEGLVLGSRAGRTAALEAGDRFDGDIAHRTARVQSAHVLDVEDLRKSLVSRMWRCVGILRDAEGLPDAAASIRRWRHFVQRVKLFGRAGFELENMLLLGALITESAKLRRESRGTHARGDFPDRDDASYLGSFFWKSGEAPRFRSLESVTSG